MKGGRAQEGDTTYTFHIVSVACCRILVASPTISNRSPTSASTIPGDPIHRDCKPVTFAKIVKKNPTIPPSWDGRWRVEVRNARYGCGVVRVRISAGRTLGRAQPVVSHPFPNERGLLAHR